MTNPPPRPTAPPPHPAPSLPTSAADLSVDPQAAIRRTASAPIATNDRAPSVEEGEHLIFPLVPQSDEARNFDKRPAAVGRMVERLRDAVPGVASSRLMEVLRERSYDLSSAANYLLDLPPDPGR